MVPDARKSSRLADAPQPSYEETEDAEVAAKPERVKATRAGLPLKTAKSAQAPAPKTEHATRAATRALAATAPAGDVDDRGPPPGYVAYPPKVLTVKIRKSATKGSVKPTPAPSPARERDTQIGQPSLSNPAGKQAEEEDDSGDDSDSQVANSLIPVSPQKLATIAPTDAYPSPSTTPSKSIPKEASRASGKRKADESEAVGTVAETSLLTKRPKPGTKRRASSVPIDIEEEEEVAEMVEMEDVRDGDESSSDELDLLYNTPSKAIKSRSFRTPQTHQYSDPTSRSSSNRQRNLPAAPNTLTPANRILITHLVEYEDFLLAPEIIDEPSTADLDDLVVPRLGSSTLYSRGDLLQLYDRLGARLCNLDASVSYADSDVPKLVADYPTLDGLAKWEKEVRYAVEDVVERGVGNCLVLLGQRGVGKTLIVERSLNVLSTVHGRDSFIAVRLNGLVQTTDRLVMREIARQLCSSGAIDESGDYGSHAGTMTTLLRLLEPPTRGSDVASGDKPVIFIVDEFDLFALHPRQSFLYCLLDIVQGSKRRAGMGVIGISSRTDCLSVLEKRVRSRCQSHVLQMAPENDFSTYLSLARSLLSDGNGDDDDAITMAWNSEVEAFLGDQPVIRYFDRLWKLNGNNATPLRQALIKLYQKVESSLSSVLDASILIPRLGVRLLPPNGQPGRSDLLQGLTVIELSVCVAAKHVLSTTETFNFEMLYDLYDQHTKRGQSVVAAKHFSKSAFAIALDRLRLLEVVVPASGKPNAFVSPSIASNYKMWRFVPWAATLDEEVNRRSDVPQPLKRWCKNWLG